jgi:hypothetical protein
MTLPEIRAYVDRLHLGGTILPRLLTDYYGRIAFPCVTFIMVVVGIALSLRRTGVRGSGMAMGIGQAIGRRILLLVHPFRGNCAGTRRGTCADAGRLDGQSGISDVWLLSAVEGPLLRGSRNSPPAAFAIRQSQHRSRVPDAYSIDCGATVR